MAEVLRNEDHVIIDTDKFPLEESAGYSVAEVRRRGEEAERAHELANLAINSDHTSTEDAYEKVRELRVADEKLEAAKWRNYEHYRNNSAGYQEAAIEEDTRRTEEKEKAEAEEAELDKAISAALDGYAKDSDTWLAARAKFYEVLAAGSLEGKGRLEEKALMAALESAKDGAETDVDTAANRFYYSRHPRPEADPLAKGEGDRAGAA
jgi:hypothetical protein